MTRRPATKTKKTPIVRGVDVPYANQFLPDPRQQTAWAAYINPKSDTYGNATQSALKAGFSEGHAAQITTQEWWLALARRLTLLHKAERNLEEALDLPMKTQAMGAFGPLFETKAEQRKGRDGKIKTVQVPVLKKGKRIPIMTHNIGLLNIRTSAAQFVAERVGKARYGKKEGEGGNTFNIVVFNHGQLKRIATRTLRGGDDGGAESEETSH